MSGSLLLFEPGGVEINAVEIDGFVDGSITILPTLLDGEMFVAPSVAFFQLRLDGVFFVLPETETVYVEHLPEWFLVPGRRPSIPWQGDFVLDYSILGGYDVLS